MLYLKEANFEDMEKEWLFVKSMPEDENGFTNQWCNISREEFGIKALPDMVRFSKGIDLPDWMVPETFLFLWNEREIVGQFRIRHYLNDALREGAGHIGYFIGKEFRGKGYATEGLRLALEIAGSWVPEKDFYLRVNKDNPASLQVMLKNGGRIVGENEKKYFVRIHNFVNYMQIRTATINDLESITAVEAECFPPAEAATKEALEQRLKYYSNHFWLMFDGDRLISFVDGFVTNESDLTDEMYENAEMHDENGKWQMIFGVNTIPAYRNHGYAGELIRRMIVDARQQGRSGLVLTCKDALVDYYAKFGFRNEGRSESQHGGAAWNQMRLLF